MSVLDQVQCLLLDERLSEYDLQDIAIREHRDVTEVEVKNPRHFLLFARGLENLGWVGVDQSLPQRRLLGVVFDSEPKVAILISVGSLAEWFRRYRDGVTRTPVPELVSAANAVVSGSGKLCDRLQAAIEVERRIYGV